MGKPVRFAVIGCGLIARFHIAALRSIPEAELAGVCGSGPERSRQAAQAFQTRAYLNREEIWRDPEVDAVCVCTPSGLHGQIALEALEHGKHVLIEKPMALSLAGCDRVIAMAEAQGLQLGVVSQLRFSPAVTRVKQALDSGLLGRLVCADLYMKYHRSQDYYDAAPWRGTLAMDGGGALMNQGIHGVDLLQYLAGPATSIFARSAALARQIEVEDTLSAVVTFSSGALGVVQASTGVWPGAPRRLELCGERGTIVLEEDVIVRWETGDASVPPEDFQHGTAVRSSGDPAKIDPDGHRRQLENFTAAIQGREQLLAGGRAGRSAVELVLAAYRSAGTGQPVQLSPARTEGN